MVPFETSSTIAQRIAKFSSDPSRQLVCVQGLGFVGAAMAVAIAQARNPEGNPYFYVVGIDLPTPEGLARINAINEGVFPFECEDAKLTDAMRQAHQDGNFLATPDPEAYKSAKVVVVDINLDVVYENGKPLVALEGFKKAIETLAVSMPPGCLVVVETTVLPGTCANVVAPIFARGAAARGLPEDAFLLAHAYERVMPGREYFDSIVNFWRVYSGHTQAAADACENFLSKVIDVKKFPLTRLSSTTASETGKVLENSYRAVNIAFMEEWGRFAERLNLDLFEVIRSIRVRPTHVNIRQPGFGVGGYCLTKDPLMASIAARDIFNFTDLEFPFCKMAVDINRLMPLVTIKKVEELLGGALKDKRILLMGISYRQDVGDTRHSPSQIFFEEARKRGAQIICHDPYVSHWLEMNLTLKSDLPDPQGIQAVVFAVPHEPYRQLNISTWLQGVRPYIIDSNDVLTPSQLQDLRENYISVWRIGRGTET
jgi:UDP-N-acetyl-D-glucosamine dehydrogenase